MKTAFYVQFEPRQDKYSKKVTEVIPVTVSQGKPRAPKGGAILVQFSVEFDDRIFEPFAPSVIVKIPLGHPAVIVAESVEVEDE